MPHHHHPPKKRKQQTMHPTMQRDLQKFAQHQMKKSNPMMTTTMAMATIVLLFCKVKSWNLKVKNNEFLQLFGELGIDESK